MWGRRLALRSTRNLSSKPRVSMLLYECVVIELGVSESDAIDLLGLAGSERLVRVEAPRSFEETLPSQHFVNARDAATEPVRGVEDRRVGVSPHRGLADKL